MEKAINNDCQSAAQGVAERSMKDNTGRTHRQKQHCEKIRDQRVNIRESVLRGFLQQVVGNDRQSEGMRWNVLAAAAAK